MGRGAALRQRVRDGKEFRKADRPTETEIEERDIEGEETESRRRNKKVGRKEVDGQRGEGRERY